MEPRATRLSSGAVFYLNPPRTARRNGKPSRCRTCRRFIGCGGCRAPGGGFELLSVPLHGHGNKNGEGEGVPIMTYRKPADPRQPWTTNTLAKQWHKTHNFDPRRERPFGSAAKEGIFEIGRAVSEDAHCANWRRTTSAASGKCASGKSAARSRSSPPSSRCTEPISPFHAAAQSTRPRVRSGSAASSIPRSPTATRWRAATCSASAAIKSSSAGARWGSKAKVGVKLFTPLANDLKEWRTTLVDDNGMACEDLCLADLNGDGKLDIIAAGRATKNVKIYFNETAR